MVVEIGKEASIVRQRTPGHHLQSEPHCMPYSSLSYLVQCLGSGHRCTHSPHQMPQRHAAEQISKKFSTNLIFHTFHIKYYISKRNQHTFNNATYMYCCMHSWNSVQLVLSPPSLQRTCIPYLVANSPRVLPLLQEEIQAPLLRHRSPARRKKLTISNKIGMKILEAVKHFLV